MSVEDQVDCLLGSNNNSNDDVVVAPVVKSRGKGLFGFLRQFWYGALIGMLIVTLTLLVPVYNGKTGLDVLQEFFESNDSADVVGVGDDPPPESEAYHYWYAPPDSFGVSEMKMVNWSHFQALFNEHFYKKALYKRYSYSEWTNGTEYLTLNKTWNESGFWKVDVILDVPIDLYSVNISFGCDLPVLDYVEREGHEIWINYSANATETYSIFFNWSDIVQIPNLEIFKVRQDGKFWISFKRDNIPAGHYVFDPTFGQQNQTGATNFQDYIVSTWGEPSSSGTADEICVYISTTSAHDIKGALYTYVDYSSDFAGSLIATTEERSINDVGWKTFTFASPPSITGGTRYYLAVWSNTSVVSGCDCGYDTQAGYAWYDSESYNGFPDPPTGEVAYGDRFSIYCNYTEGAVNTAPTVEVYSPDNASTGNNLSGYCRIWVNDTDGNDVNITWRTNESGSYVTIADNNSVSCNASYDLYFADFNSDDSQYWWEILCDDGTDNVSKRFWFETAANITWQIIDQTINGSYINTTAFQVIDVTINGSYVNITAWRDIDITVNGSYYNDTILWQNIDTIVNGSYINTTTWQEIDITVNGSYINTTTWQNIDTTVNGSYINITAWRNIDVTINGSYYNDTTLWQNIDITINGSYVNTTAFQVIDVTINGSYVNTTTWQNIDTTVNGSYINITAWRNIDVTINGSYYNDTTLWQNIDVTINGSYSNTSLPWNIIDITINGSYTNTSVVVLSLTDEYPTNGSNIFSVQPTLYFTLASPVGDMSYKLYIGNTNITTDYLLDSDAGLDNGTFHYVNYYNASSFGTSYWWRIHYNDTVTHVNETFSFSPVLAGGGGMGTGGTAVSIIGVIGIFGLLGWIMSRRRREG